MLNKFCVLLLLIYGNMSFDIQANEMIFLDNLENFNASIPDRFKKINRMNEPSEIVEKYNLSVCAIFKNEAPYLKEWIEYHRILGVDHFYLCNIGSQDHFMKVLKPYIEKEIVTLINWPEVVINSEVDDTPRLVMSTQIPAYENVVNFRSKGETKWLTFVDVEEFLVYPAGQKITDLLERYDQYSEISLTSNYFDAAIDDVNPNKELLIQTLELSKPPKVMEDKTVAKMIFKPEDCLGFTWPPYKCRLKNPDSSVSLENRELHINHYINRNIRYFPFGKLKRKIDVDNRTLSSSEIISLLEDGYNIEDQDRPIYQHIPELLKRMGQK